MNSRDKIKKVDPLGLSFVIPGKFSIIDFLKKLKEYRQKRERFVISELSKSMGVNYDTFDRIVDKIAENGGIKKTLDYDNGYNCQVLFSEEEIDKYIEVYRGKDFYISEGEISTENRQTTISPIDWSEVIPSGVDIVKFLQNLKECRQQGGVFITGDFAKLNGINYDTFDSQIAIKLSKNGILEKITNYDERTSLCVICFRKRD